MAVPNLTDEERAKALMLALENRTKRAEVREKLSKGELSAKEVLDMRDDDVIGRMMVLTFLESLPGYGKVKSEKIMREVGISYRRRLRGLGKRQIKELLEILA